MFMQSERFSVSPAGKLGNIGIYDGHESNYAWVQRMVPPDAGDELCRVRIVHRVGAA